MDSSVTVDALAIMAHPDDAELACGGTLLKLQAMGYRTAVADLTQGELGTRGSAELRAQEANAASKVLGLSTRMQLGLADGFFEETEDSLRRVVSCIRQLRPALLFVNAPQDRHPDHGRAHSLVQRACFLAGLPKIETLSDEGTPQEAWRPKQVVACIQDVWLTPSFVVDISPYFERKLEAIACYSSQFWQPRQTDESDTQPQTPISTAEFWQAQRSRAKEVGHFLRVDYAEGFIVQNPLHIKNPMELF